MGFSAWEASPGGFPNHERDSNPVKMAGHDEEVTACALSRFDRGVIASCSDDNTIKLWRMDLEASLPKYTAVPSSVGDTCLRAESVCFEQL